MKMWRTRKFRYFLIGFTLIALAIFFAGLYLNNIINGDAKSDVSDTSSILDEYNYIIDFESKSFLLTSEEVTSDKALSGKYSSKINSISNFSSTIEIPINTNDSTFFTETNVKFWINPTTDVIDATFVFSIFDEHNNQVHWDGYTIKRKELTPDIWYPFSHTFPVPGIYVDKRNTIRMYVWSESNKDNPIHIDDIAISLDGEIEYEKPRTFLFAFEDVVDNRISSKFSYQGFYSTFAKGEDSFSVNSIIPFSDFKTADLQSISYRFHLLSENSNIDAVFVAEIIDKDGNNLSWQGTQIKRDDFKTEEWEIFNGQIILTDDLLDPDNYVKFYLWNRLNTTVYLDNIYIVMKGQGFLNPDDMAFCDFTKNPIYVSKANFPPYKYKYLHLQNILSKINLNNLFLSNLNLIVANFDSNFQTDEILAISKTNNSKLIYFDDYSVKYSEVKFLPKLPLNFNAYGDNHRVFIHDINANTVLEYTFNNKKKIFELYAKSDKLNIDALTDVFKMNDSIVSLITSSGKIYNLNYNIQQIEFLNSQTLIYPDGNNIKAFSGYFFNEKSKELLLIYLQNRENKYEFFYFDESEIRWKPSPNHENKSLEAFDKLCFFNSFWVGNFYTDNLDRLLMLNLSERFNLKMVEFNRLTYNILANIDFTGFTKPQNPKFYETRRIICGNFIDNDMTDVMIFQDNKRTIPEFKQKTEIYSFK